MTGDKTDMPLRMSIQEPVYMSEAAHPEGLDGVRDAKESFHDGGGCGGGMNEGASAVCGVQGIIQARGGALRQRMRRR